MQTTFLDSKQSQTQISPSVAPYLPNKKSKSLASHLRPFIIWLQSRFPNGTALFLFTPKPAFSLLLRFPSTHARTHARARTHTPLLLLFPGLCSYRPPAWMPHHCPPLGLFMYYPSKPNATFYFHYLSSYLYYLFDLYITTALQITHLVFL